MTRRARADQQGEAAGDERSMVEILGSIRRIMSEASTSASEAASDGGAGPFSRAAPGDDAWSAADWDAEEIDLDALADALLREAGERPSAKPAGATEPEPAAAPAARPKPGRGAVKAGGVGPGPWSALESLLSVAQKALADEPAAAEKDEPKPVAPGSAGGAEVLDEPAPAAPPPHEPGIRAEAEPVSPEPVSTVGAEGAPAPAKPPLETMIEGLSSRLEKVRFGASAPDAEPEPAAKPEPDAKSDPASAPELASEPAPVAGPEAAAPPPPADEDAASATPERVEAETASEPEFDPEAFDVEPEADPEDDPDRLMADFDEADHLEMQPDGGEFDEALAAEVMAAEAQAAPGVADADTAEIEPAETLEGVSAPAPEDEPGPAEAFEATAPDTVEAGVPAAESVTIEDGLRSAGEPQPTEVIEPKPAEPKSVEPKSLEPKSAEPEAVEPQTAEPGKAEVEGVATDGGEAERSETTPAEASTPETTRPEGGEPEAETAAPEPVAPAVVEPDAQDPEWRDEDPRNAPDAKAVKTMEAIRRKVMKAAAKARKKVEADVEPKEYRPPDPAVRSKVGDYVPVIKRPESEALAAARRALTEDAPKDALAAIGEPEEKTTEEKTPEEKTAGVDAPEEKAAGSAAVEVAPKSAAPPGETSESGASAEPIPTGEKAASGEDSLLAPEAREATLRALQAATRRAATGPDGAPLGDVAREELKPLLARWLNDNMPTIVERLVREELDRIKPRDDES